MDIDFSLYFWKNDRIQLRQPKEDDWRYLYPGFCRSDDRFMFNCEIDLPLDEEGFKKQYAERIQGKGDHLPFAILDTDGKHVGIANVFGINEKHGCFGPVGIQINPADRGRGYALATFRMLGGYMFEERRMHKWESSCTVENTASERLHRSLGFTQEGLRRHNTFHNGRYWDELLFGMLAEEFFAAEQARQTGAG